MKIMKRVHREHGAVAMEFALIMPVLLLILFGTIEFGRVYSQWQVFNGAAREGARCAAVQAGGFTNCDIEDRVTTAAEPYQVAGPINVSPGDGCLTAAQGTNVTVFWDQPFTISIPFWNDVTFSSRIEATFRCE